MNNDFGFGIKLFYIFLNNRTSKYDNSKEFQMKLYYIDVIS